jgi:hypothetical protein
VFNKMKVVRGPDSMGSTDWSPTVQHIERMKLRRQRRIRMIIVLVASGIGMCVTGAMVAWFVKGL